MSEFDGQPVEPKQTTRAMIVDGPWIQNLEIWLGPRSGSVALEVRSPMGGAGEVIDEASLMRLADQVWPHALRICHAVAGLDLGRIRLGRSRLSVSKRAGPINATVKRALGSVDRSTHRWSEVFIVLLMRDPPAERDLTGDYIDLYVAAWRGMYEDREDDSTDEAKSLLNSRRREIEAAIVPMGQIATEDPTCAVKLDDAIWLEECVPTLACDGFFLGGLVVNGPTSNADAGLD